MSRLTTILRATHCRSTHHFFAIDALSEVNTVQGKRLADVLLKYHDEYLVGAKAPDTSFKDFSNHVLHVQDGYWGGALKLADEWFEKARNYLDEKKWKKAAYACGVLSHYFSDPMMPLHTAQSSRESVVHRPMEWSVCKSYERIYELSHNESQNVTHAKSSEWLQETIKAGAELANASYGRLIEIYDLERGTKKPVEGLNRESQETLAKIFSYVLSGWARVLEKLADETTSKLPQVKLNLTTFLATIDMPLAWVVKRISDVNEQREVRQLFAEYQATGALEKHLPKEVRSVRRAWKQDAPRRTVAKPTSPQSAAETKTVLDRAEAKKIIESMSPPSRVRRERTSELASTKRIERNNDREKEPARPSAQIPAPPKTERRRGVSLDSQIVDAPSIGPKTARRFEGIGIDTIGQFLDADVEDLEKRLNTRWITLSLLHDWRDQAKLVCSVPALCGYKSQLLVAVGCRTSAQLKSSNAYDLGQKIEQFCQTNEGKRILRSSPMPDKNDIANWITSASDVRTQAA